MRSILGEVVRVDLFDFEELAAADAHIEVDHQLRKIQAVNQHHLRINACDVLDRIVRERAGRQKDALLRTPTVQSPDESVDFRATDRVFPTLGLEVDHVQAELIFVNNAVDSGISPLIG